MTLYGTESNIKLLLQKLLGGIPGQDGEEYDRNGSLISCYTHHHDENHPLSPPSQGGRWSPWGTFINLDIGGGKKRFNLIPLGVAALKVAQDSSHGKSNIEVIFREQNVAQQNATTFELNLHIDPPGNNTNSLASLESQLSEKLNEFRRSLSKKNVAQTLYALTLKEEDLKSKKFEVKKQTFQKHVEEYNEYLKTQPANTVVPLSIPIESNKIHPGISYAALLAKPQENPENKIRQELNRITTINWQVPQFDQAQRRFVFRPNNPNELNNINDLVRSGGAGVSPELRQGVLCLSITSDRLQSALLRFEQVPSPNQLLPN